MFTINGSQPCRICGKPATCWNVFGFACQPDHLWFVSSGQTPEQADAEIADFTAKFPSEALSPCH